MAVMLLRAAVLTFADRLDIADPGLRLTPEQILLCATQSLCECLQIGKADVHTLFDIADLGLGESADLRQPMLSVSPRLAQPSQVGRQLQHHLRTGSSIRLSHVNAPACSSRGRR